MLVSYWSLDVFFYFFFFQAEDGIRDWSVTEVQTCALPISTRTAPPEQIKAVPVRHPGRWIAAVVIAVLVAMFVHMLLTNDVFQWGFMFDNMFRPAVLRGARTTLIMTILAMLIGVLLGVVFAVMRLSPNPIVGGAAWAYIWFFRAIPRIVLLFF